jgi:hypothetical protein
VWQALWREIVLIWYHGTSAISVWSQNTNSCVFLPGVNRLGALYHDEIDSFTLMLWQTNDRLKIQILKNCVRNISKTVEICSSENGLLRYDSLPPISCLMNILRHDVLRLAPLASHFDRLSFADWIYFSPSLHLSFSSARR